MHSSPRSRGQPRTIREQSQAHVRARGKSTRSWCARAHDVRPPDPKPLSRVALGPGRSERYRLQVASAVVSGILPSSCRPHPHVQNGCVVGGWRGADGRWRRFHLLVPWSNSSPCATVLSSTSSSARWPEGGQSHSSSPFFCRSCGDGISKLSHPLQDNIAVQRWPSWNICLPTETRPSG